MINDSRIPTLYECCRIVGGNKRSLVCDIQRYSYHFLPNEVAKMLVETKGMTLESIKLKYNNEYDDIIQQNFDLLEQEELIFYTNTPEWFPEMSLEWEEPIRVTNSIIDINSQSILDFEKIWTQLSELGCEHIQLRVYDNITLEALETALSKIGTKRIISVEIIFPYDAELKEIDLINFVFRQPRIFSLILHSAPINKNIYVSESEMGNIYFMQEIVTGTIHCGKIVSEIFAINVKNFTESLHHNSCLNRKISLDVEGNIKNCPSMSQSFGNIKDTTLQEALDHPDFKKYWNVTKDQIEVCKDCEFRYICTDCRGYIENPEDMYSKPLKCGYNPYSCEWEEWSTNPLKQKAIDYYGMREVLPEFKMKPDYAPSINPDPA
jgi:SPASM domain peptide maturase of grasp-with-spasm system